ncbi:antirestriction protein [Rhizobium sp. SYY.PMSO]|uniref:antirestriction protein n=1 Tax=Rhizobium sp. SYY.PMSO TaxID=3382192 RepID=UPI0039901E53
MTTQVATSHFATLVPDHRREKFLPTLFGHRLFIIAEAAVYTIMERLSPYDYRGGFWNFYERDGQPLFLAPTSRPRYRIESDLTEFRGEVSAEAAGIIATMFTLSHLSFQFEAGLLVEGFHRLRDNLDGHSEASEIFQAID